MHTHTHTLHYCSSNPFAFTFSFEPNNTLMMTDGLMFSHFTEQETEGWGETEVLSSLSEITHLELTVHKPPSLTSFLFLIFNICFLLDCKLIYICNKNALAIWKHTWKKLKALHSSSTQRKALTFCLFKHISIISYYKPGIILGIVVCNLSYLMAI